jgi:Leucine-rich repeat (LRR) protein
MAEKSDTDYYLKWLSASVRNDPEKFTVAKLTIPHFDRDVEIQDIYLPDTDKGLHSAIFCIRTPGRWYYFYKKSNTSGEIIGNDLDGISSSWQSKLNVEPFGMRQFEQDILHDSNPSKNIGDIENSLAEELSYLRKIEDGLGNKLRRTHNFEDWAVHGYFAEKSHITSLAVKFKKDTPARTILNYIQPLSHLKKLAITSYTHTSFPVNLSNLANLEIFNIYTERFAKGSPLSELPAWIGNLSKLKVFDCFTSNLDQIPKEFMKLVNLSFLRLDTGKLKKIPTNIGDLKNLTTLRLSNNLIEEIPDSLCTLEKLATLWLDNNKISNLPTNIGDLKKLRDLKLFGNRISGFPKSSGKLVNLQSIDFGHNQIRTLPDFLLHPNPMLKINARRNLIREFPEEYLKNPADKTRFDFDFNFDLVFRKESWICEECGGEFVVTHSDVYDRSCQFCQTINPFHMKIRNIRTEQDLKSLTKNAQKMKRLKISGKIAQHVLKSSPELPNLTFLKINDLPETFLPDNFSKFKSLRELEMIMDNLEDIPRSISQLEYLKFFHIKSHKVTEWKVETPKMVNLEDLHLALPKMGKIPKWIINCRKLKALSFYSECENIEFPEEILAMPSLKNLGVSQEVINNLPEQLKRKVEKFAKILPLSWMWWQRR